jgi:type II secretory pathway pseudopilin PulG
MSNLIKNQQKNNSFLFAGYKSNAGFSFVELIVTVAIFSLVFGGLFASFQVMTSLIGSSKAKAGALSLMSSKMEYVRSLPYSSIGTDGGVPSGIISQNSTTTLNGIEYSQRVLIQYIDDAADGVGGADTNGILADYKQAKVEYTWSIRGKTSTVALVSNIVPLGIESTAGGGTIKVNVFDANVAPLAGVGVHFVNNTTAPTIDTWRYTDLSGIVYLSGAPAEANYEITVSDTGYSTDGTYTATASNPNPSTQPVAVAESLITTMNFQIDQLSDLLVSTVGPATYNSFFDTFTDSSLIATTSNTDVAAGEVVLSDVLGVYEVLGTVQGTNTNPVTIESWYSVSFVASTTVSTAVKVSVLYNNGGTLELVPEGDLSGNSVGFTNSPIDISSLDIATYPELRLSAELSTIDTVETPVLHQWELAYITSQTPIPGVQLAIEGAKEIGVDGASQPVLKYSDTGVSDASGQWIQDDIEWDVYTVSVTSPGYSIYEVCASSPITLGPDVSENMVITLAGASPQLLRVIVNEPDGTPVPDALVQLENAGVDVAQLTSLCGQTYFNTGLYNDDDYVLTVSAFGFSTEVLSSTTVSSSSTVNVILN